ncbi:MAG: hypothetical protein QM784_31485 [Polyangiaceae bacterium]
MSRRLVLFVSFALGWSPRPIWAANPPAPPATLEVESSTPRAPSLSNEEVEQRYKQAQVAYSEGDLREAARLLSECFAATHSPNLLFNLAQLYREMKECQTALSYYDRYLAEVKDGGRAEDAKAYVTELRAECPPTPPASVETRPVEPHTEAAPVPASTPATKPAASPPSRTNPWKVVGWATLGTSAVAAAATVYASIETKHAHDDSENPRMVNGRIDGDYVAERQDDFYRNRNWAFAFGAATTGLIGFGLYALAIAAPRYDAQHERASSLAVTVLPGHASVLYGFQF